MTDTNTILTEMNDRSREVFRRVVQGYLDNGEPVGSRTLTRDFSEKISAATIRNVSGMSAELSILILSLRTLSLRTLSLNGIDARTYAT